MLAQRSDVAHLYANPHVTLDAPVVETSPECRTEGIEWNIALGQARTRCGRWGYTGQGVVIGGQDTGYQWDHPALKNQYRGWDGASVDHDYNWFDATADTSLTPVDPRYGHGTHTMGTMVGDDGARNQIGMAPGARWIGCRNMDAGEAPQTPTLPAISGSLLPPGVDGSDPRPALAPDVINNSWSCPVSEGCTDPNVLLDDWCKTSAAGIVTVHSAGNSGSGCSTVRTPAAIYDESFTVGATDSMTISSPILAAVDPSPWMAATAPNRISLPQGVNSARASLEGDYVR